MTQHGPLKSDQIGAADQLGVQEIKVSNVRAVLGYLLNVTINVVDALAAEVELGLHRQRLVLDLVLVGVSRVIPDHDAVVSLDDMVLLELDVALVALLQVRAVLLLARLLHAILVLVLLHGLRGHVVGGDHTVACLALEHPPVEGTLYAVVLHLASVAQVGAHVRAVRVQGEHLPVLASEDDNAAATVAEELDLVDFELVRVEQTVPAISKFLLKQLNNHIWRRNAT